MAAKRIPALTVLTGAQSATDDKVVIFDVTADETKAITRVELAKGLAIDLAGIQRVQNFSGNGSTVAFTLTYDPSTENNTQVYVNGVYQQKNTYAVSGTTLTFSEAPPVGSTIEVMIQRA
jgi:hypothetical protein